MKTRSASISPRLSARRWLIASLLLISVATLLGLRLANWVHAGVPIGDGIDAPVSVSAKEATNSLVADADPALERMIALHRGVMLAPLQAEVVGACCGPAVTH